MGSRSPSPEEKHLRAAVGRALWERRRARKVSQGEIARHLGVVLNTVRKYEAGETALPTTTLLRIAAFLDCQPAELLPAYGPATGGETACLS